MIKETATPMEICSMDHSSQQYSSGMSSDQYNMMINDEFPFKNNNIIPTTNQCNESGLLTAPIEYHQLQQDNYPHTQVNFTDNNSWVIENIKCKREIDLSDASSRPQTSNFLLNEPTVDEFSSNCNDFNDPYRNYSSFDSTKYINDSNSNLINSSDVVPVFTRPLDATQIEPDVSLHRSFQMSSTKSQLPTWYHPPSSSYYQQPLNQHHPAYPPPYREGYYRQHQEPNMRNMINMSNR